MRWRSEINARPGEFAERIGNRPFALVHAARYESLSNHPLAVDGSCADRGRGWRAIYPARTWKVCAPTLGVASRARSLRPRKRLPARGEKQCRAYRADCERDGGSEVLLPKVRVAPAFPTSRPSVSRASLRACAALASYGQTSQKVIKPPQVTCSSRGVF